ncbi:MAG: MFS transporter [Clostridia bacterium]|nr:MFS transporter [Clostridia bacterium]
MKTNRLKTYVNKHYHWVVAAVLVLALFTHGGSCNNLSSLHVVPVGEALGISRSAFSLALVGKTITTLISTFLSGFLISHIGSRAALSIGLFSAAGAYVILATAQNYAMLVLGGALLGATYGFCSTSGATKIVQDWFHAHKGAVLGFVTSASGIGGSVLCIIQTWAMDTFSWRASFYTCAIVIAVVTVLALWLVRSHPHEKGLLPLGEGEEVAPTKRRKAVEDAHPGLPMPLLWKRPAFYLMMFCTLLLCFCIYMAFTVVRPFLVDCGFSSTQASGLQSTMMLLLTGSKFMVGFLCDRFGAKRINLTCAVLTILSLVLLATVGNYFSAIAAIVVYALALPAVTVMIPLVGLSLFGTRAQPQYTGILLAISSAALFLGEYVTNLIHDLLGSYRPAFWLAAGLAVVSVVLFLLLYRLAEKDRPLENQVSPTEKEVVS